MLGEVTLSETASLDTEIAKVRPVGRKQSGWGLIWEDTMVEKERWSRWMGEQAWEMEKRRTKGTSWDAGQHAWALRLITTIHPMFSFNSLHNYFLCKDLALPNTEIIARTLPVRNSCSQASAVGWCMAHSFCILSSLFASFLPLKLGKRDKRLRKQER